MGFLIDALSGLDSGVQPSLVFKTDFRSAVALDAPLLLGSDGGTPPKYVQAYTYVKGVDGQSGFDVETAMRSYLGSKTDFLIQSLPTVRVLDAADLATHMTAELAATTLSDDPAARELKLTLIKRDATTLSANPQIDPMFIRRRDDFATTNAIPIPQIPSIYYKYDFILDPNLASIQTSPEPYLVLADNKMGDLRSSYPSGAFSTSVGSGRFSMIVSKKTTGELFISSRWDNIAGAIGIYPTGSNPKTGFYFAPFTLGKRSMSVGDVLRGATSLTQATVQFVDLRLGSYAGSDGKGVLILTNSGDVFTDGEVLQVESSPGVWSDCGTVAKFWNGLESKALTNPEEKYLYAEACVGTVPLGEPLTLEVRHVIPQSRTDIVTGITQAVLTRKNTGERITLCDFRGGIQAGALEDPFTRFMPCLNYTNYNQGASSINIVQRFTNFEVWTDAPYTLIP